MNTTTNRLFVCVQLLEFVNNVICRGV